MTSLVTGPVRYGSPALRTLLAQVGEGAAERERERKAPYEALAAVRAAGLGRLRIPLGEGGGGASVREFFEVLVDLAAADSNVAHILRTHFAFVEQQLANPDLAERARWLAVVNADRLFGNGSSEQNGQAVGSGPETTLTPDGTGFRLNGRKFYSTGSLYADLTQISAVTPDGRRAAVIVPTDRDGVHLDDDWDGFGQRLTGTGTTRLENVRVAADEVTILGRPGDARPPNVRGTFLQLYLQAVTAGVLAAVRADAVALVRRRRRGFSHAGAGLPAEDPQVLQVVGEIAADAFAARAIVLVAAEAIQDAVDSELEGAPDPAAAHRAQLAAADAKVAIDRFSYATAARLFDAGGASATQEARNLDRHWRNARTISTHNPTFLKATAVGDWHVNGNPPPDNGFF
jgi:alkylation response protein AidB-like acyl-CoA dehydrogenase